MTISFFIIISVLLVITLIALPFQYRYIAALKEQEMKQKAKNKSQGEMYDAMNAGELVLHENAQGNPLFLPANIIAGIIYHIKHRKNK